MGARTIDVDSHVLEPSDLWEKNLEPEERTVPSIAQLVGADRILWASDYPHSEGHADVLKDVLEAINPLPGEDQQKILGGNAAKLYGLPQN
ncbi:MAG: amidohydrolase family protein [Dehalococcoidia bacterium]